MVDVSSCGPSGRLLMWRLWRLLMWRLCWGRSLQLGFYARQSYLVFSTQASFGFFVGSISRSIFRSSCLLNLNILLLVHIFALDSWLLSILIMVDAFKAVDDSEWSKLELPRSCPDLGLSLNCLYDFFNSSFAYWAVWGSLPILFGTRITTYLCWDSFQFWKT